MTHRNLIVVNDSPEYLPISDDVHLDIKKLEYPFVFGGDPSQLYFVQFLVQFFSDGYCVKGFGINNETI